MYNPSQVTAFSPSEAKKLSKSNSTLGGNVTAPRSNSSTGGKTTRQLPTGGKVDVPDWAIGSQYDVPAVPLIEPTPKVNPRAPVVVTSKQAQDKLDAAQMTVDMANGAMQAQSQSKRELQAAKLRQEEEQRQADAEEELAQRQLNQEAQGTRDIQASLDEVKQNLGAPVKMTPSEEENRAALGGQTRSVSAPTPASQPSGYFDEEGMPIDASDRIFSPNRQNQLRNAIAAGKIATSEDPLQAEFDRRSAQAEKAWEEHNEQVDKLLAGAIPLTPAQQQQVTSLRADFDALKEEQTKANKNYQGGLSVLAINTGQNRYAPDIALGEMNQAINDGVQKIARLDSQAAQTIAAMQEAFQKDNFAIIDKAYDDYSSFLEQRQETIQNMQAAAAAAVVAEREWNYKVAQDEISNMFKQSDLDLATKAQAIDAAYKDAQITLEQRKVLNDELKMHNDMAIANARLALDRAAQANANVLNLQNGQKLAFDQNMQVAGFVADQEFRNQQVELDWAKLSLEQKKAAVEESNGTLELRDGSVVDARTGEKPIWNPEPQQVSVATNSLGVPMSSGFDATLIPGVTKMQYSGLMYFDPSQFGDDKYNKQQMNLAQNEARRMGITVVSPAEKKALGDLETALQNLDQMEDDWRQIAPTSLIGKLTSPITGAIQSSLDFGKGDVINRYQKSYGKVIATLDAISGNNALRLNPDAIQGLKDSLPSFTTRSLSHNTDLANDSLGTGLAQFQGTRQFIYSGFRSALPTAVLPSSGDKKYAPTPEGIKAFRTAHPEKRALMDQYAAQGFSNEYIMAAVND